MAFDDPRFTRPNMGGAIGNLLQNLIAQSQNRQKLQLAEKEIGFKDPSRKIQLTDLLSLTGDIYKTQSAYSGFPGYTPQQFDPNQFATILKGLQSLISGTGGGGVPSGMPAGGGIPAPQSSAPPPQTSRSILGSYLQPSQPAQPSAPPTPVTKKGSSYRSLWTSQ